MDLDEFVKSFKTDNVTPYKFWVLGNVNLTYLKTCNYTRISCENDMKLVNYIYLRWLAFIQLQEDTIT